MTIADTVHDKMSHLIHLGVSDGPLRYRAEWSYHQNHINEPRLEGTIEFKFKDAYKARMAFPQTTLGTLHIKSYCYQENKNKMYEAPLRESVWFKALSKDMQETLIKMTKEAMQNPPQ